jgi:hypothetical protein
MRAGTLIGHRFTPFVSDIFLLFSSIYFSYLLDSVAFMTFESSFTIGTRG